MTEEEEDKINIKLNDGCLPQKPDMCPARLKNSDNCYYCHCICLKIGGPGTLFRRLNCL